MTDAIPSLTRVQMVEVDRLMVEEAGITLIQMMENAGRSLADLAIDRYRPSSVTVLAGSGGNGGGALVAARHLANRGVTTRICLTRAVRDLRGVVRRQYRALALTATETIAGPTQSDLTIDGIIGYSLQGSPRGRAARLIEWATGVEAPILSLDTPSGVDVTTGQIGDPAIRADATMTLALPKSGLVGHPNVGCHYLADISVPPALYDRVGISVRADMFATGLVREVPAPVGTE